MPKFDVRPESFVFSTPIQVMWGDMDSFGHVNNAHYLSYFQQARCDFLTARGLPIRYQTEGPMVVHAEVRYRAQAAYPAILRVHLRTVDLRRSSFRMEYAVYNEKTGALTADGQTLLMWVGFETGRRAELPQAWRNVLLVRS